MDWQPIESAPQDGSPILLVSREGFIGFGRMSCERYEWDEGKFHEHLREDACWMGKRSYEERTSFWMGGTAPSEATHWMPVPNPPEAA